MTEEKKALRKVSAGFFLPILQNPVFGISLLPTSIFAPIFNALQKNRVRTPYKIPYLGFRYSRLLNRYFYAIIARGGVFYDFR